MKPPKIRQHGWHAVNKKEFLKRWEKDKPEYLKKAVVTRNASESSPNQLRNELENAL